MKAEEHTDAQDRCDYHSRMAYHSMLMFLDSTPLLQHPTGGQQNVNQSIGYMEHSDTTSVLDHCRICDPQLDLIPASCAYDASYGHSGISDSDFSDENHKNQKVAPGSISSSKPDLGTQLEDLDRLLAALNGQLEPPATAVSDVYREPESPNKPKLDVTACGSSGYKPQDFKGKFPTLTQLTCIERYLENKAKFLRGSTCRIQNKAQVGNIELPCDVARGLAQVQVSGMLSQIRSVEMSATSGKDCRSVIMIVQ
jgi:hypothetical protein